MIGLLRLVAYAITGVSLAGLTLVGLLALSLATGWFNLVLPKAEPPLPDLKATPPLMLGGETLSLPAWQRQRAALFERFENHVYGTWPGGRLARVKAVETLSPDTLPPGATLEILRVDVGLQDRALNLALVLPVGPGPHPVFMVQIFCGVRTGLPGVSERISNDPQPAPCEASLAMPIIKLIFGSQINNPPYEALIERGYGAVLMHPGDIVPDVAPAATPWQDRLTPSMEEPRTGAIAAWAWAFSKAVDALSAHDRVDGERLIAYGHSRHGKAALLAGAYDERIAAVISHQSGTGGASLNREKAGETVGQITASYPHWFTPRFADYAGREEDLPVDQHHLIALNAPRPVLIGNSWRDEWSDPAGAFVAARAASPVWILYGVEGLKADAFANAVSAGRLGFYLRSGRHAVTDEDWAVFFDFADTHLPD